MHKDLHLLIVEHPERAEGLVEDLRRAGYEPVFEHAASRESMLEALRRSPWDLVLAGHENAGFGSLAAIEVLTELEIDTPLVIVSQSGPDEKAVEAMRLGARDFISMNNPGRLAAVVERELASRAPGPRECHEMFEANPLPLWFVDLETLRFLEVNGAAIAHYGYSREEFLSMTLAEIRPPEDLPLLMTAFGNVGGGVVDAGVWRHRKKDGTQIRAEVHIRKLTFRGRPAEMTMVVDVTDRWRRQQDLAAQASIAGTVAETSMVLSWAQSLAEGLQGCTEILQRQCETACAQIWLLNEREGMLEMSAHSGCSFALDRVAVGESEVGRVAAKRKPYVRFESNKTPVCGGECPNSTDFSGFAAHPLMVEDRLVGVLAAYSDRAFDRGAMQALASVAGAIAQFIERKRAGEALRDSEEQVRLLLDSITDAIYGVDLNGHCTLANRACLQQLGYHHASEVIGKNMHRLVHHTKADGAAYAVEDCHFFRVFQTGEVFQADAEVLWRADGSKFLAACRSYPQRQGGRISGAVVTFTDITEKRQAQDEQRKLASIVEGSDDFIAVASPAGELMYVNPGGCRMIGLDHSRALIGARVSQLHPSHLLPKIETEIIPMAMQSGTWKGEFQLRHWVTGAPIDVSMNAFIVRDPVSGEVLCMATVIRDITERKHAEEEHRKLASIVENSEDFIGLASPTGEILYINPGGCRMIGVDDTRELAGQPISSTVPPSLHAWMGETMLPSLMADGSWEGESQVLNRKTGQLIEVSSRVAVVRQPDTGEPICIATVTRDIRQVKQAERTLLRAKEAAEAASRAKSEFLANMSHEIRTPMNGIIGMTDLALQTDLNAEQRDYLENVRKSADYLLDVINEVLDFSKIEAGRMSLDPAEFLLSASIEEILKSLSLRAHQQGLELLCRIDPDVPEHILADSYRLRQILINLLGNAVKFTERGEILLEVKVDSRQKSEVMLQFSVRDTGLGIAPDKQQLIFEAFTQADGSMTRRYGGTGLGLAISRHLVRLMGGRMWLESVPGKSSTFFFTILAKIAERGSLSSEAPVPLLSGIRVLIVDDNATNRRILEQYVAQWGMIPVSAPSASAGLAILLSQESGPGRKTENPEFGLILLDARMPDVDGFSLARSIRNHPALSGAAIMMLSSDDLHVDAQKCRDLGIDVYLVKPVLQRDLRAAILRALKTGAAPELSALASNIGSAASHGALQVLLVEDNAVNQKLAQRLLEKRGHHVTVAGDGARALEAHGRACFDVILMDLQMPGMGGLEATRLIRDRERKTNAHVPIIALTAHAITGDRERCLAAGMDDYVSKPIQPDRLFETIERLTAPGALLPAD